MRCEPKATGIAYKSCESSIWGLVSPYYAEEWKLNVEKRSSYQGSKRKTQSGFHCFDNRLDARLYGNTKDYIVTFEVRGKIAIGTTHIRYYNGKVGRYNRKIKDAPTTTWEYAKPIKVEVYKNKKYVDVTKDFLNTP